MDDEKIPCQNPPLLEKSPSGPDVLELPELSTPAGGLLAESPLKLQKILSEETLNTGRRGNVKAVPDQVSRVTPEQVSKIISHHKLPSCQYLAVSRASVKYFSQSSEDFREVFGSSKKDHKFFQRKLIQSGEEIAPKIEWKPVEYQYTFVEGIVREQSYSKSTMYLTQYLQKVEIQGHLDLEVCLL